MKLLKLAITGVFIAAASLVYAASGCDGQFPAGYVCGNPTAVKGLPGATPSAPIGAGEVTATGATRTFTSADNYKVIMRSNSGAAMVDTIPGTGSFLPNQTLVTVYNNDTSVYAVTLATGATLDGSSLPVYVGAKQTLSFLSNGASYISYQKPLRVKLGADTSFYVNIGVGSNLKPGITSGTGAFANLQQSYDILQKYFDLNGFTATVNVADGNYTDNFSMVGPVPGATKPSLLKYIGNVATPANVLWRPAGGTSGLNASQGAKAQLQGIQFRSLNQHGIAAVDAGTYLEILNVDFSLCVGSQVYASGYSQIDGIGNYTISSAADSHLSAVAGGFINMEGAYTYTITGVPTFSEFALARYAGFIDHKAGIFVNGAGTSCSAVVCNLGKRFSIQSLAIIHTGTSSDPDYFPGNAAGTNSTTFPLGGYYD